MKKFLIALLLCLVMIIPMAVPALGSTGSFGNLSWSFNTENDVSYFGQSFIPGENMYVTKARLWIESSSEWTPARSVTVAITETDGTNVGTSASTSVTYDGNWGINQGYFDFNFSPAVQLTGSTTYYLVINSTTGGDNALCYRWDPYDPYDDGDLLTWNGSSFVASPGDDLAFGIFYYTNTPPDVSDAVPSVETIWSPNNKFVDVNILGVTDADGDTVTIEIDGIISDEPTGTIPGAGGGNNAPDAIIYDDGSFQLRAERSGTGDGRVYVINFTAFDGQGGETTGSVTVTVPHDVNSIAVDSRGTSYDATVFN